MNEDNKSNKIFISFIKNNLDAEQITEKDITILKNLSKDLSAQYPKEDSSKLSLILANSLNLAYNSQNNYSNAINELKKENSSLNAQIINQKSVFDEKCIGLQHQIESLQIQLSKNKLQNAQFSATAQDQQDRKLIHFIRELTSFLGVSFNENPTELAKLIEQKYTNSQTLKLSENSEEIDPSLEDLHESNINPLPITPKFQKDDSELLEEIIQAFQLSTTTTRDELISVLKKRFDDKELKDQIVFLNNKIKQIQQNQKPNIQKSTKEVQVDELNEDLKNEINQLKLQLNEANTQLLSIPPPTVSSPTQSSENENDLEEEYQQRIYEIQAVNDKTTKKLRKRIKSLGEAMAQANEEICMLKNDNSEKSLAIETMEKEIQKADERKQQIISNVLDVCEKNIKQQSDKLIQMYEHRNKFRHVILKQQQYIEALENQLQKNVLQKTLPKSSPETSISLSLIDIISQNMDSLSPNTVTELRRILTTSANDEAKVIGAFRQLLVSKPKCDPSIIHSLLSFISSGAKETSLFPKEGDIQHTANNIEEEARRVTEFIKKQNIDFSEMTPTLFGILTENDDISALSREIRDYFVNYFDFVFPKDTVPISEVEKLITIVHEATGAAYVLKKHAEKVIKKAESDVSKMQDQISAIELQKDEECKNAKECKKHIEILDQEIKSLNEQISKLEAENQELHVSEQKLKERNNKEMQNKLIQVNIYEMDFKETQTEETDLYDETEDKDDTILNELEEARREITRLKEYHSQTSALSELQMSQLEDKDNEIKDMKEHMIVREQEYTKQIKSLLKDNKKMRKDFDQLIDDYRDKFMRLHNKNKKQKKAIRSMQNIIQEKEKTIDDIVEKQKLALDMEQKKYKTLTNEKDNLTIQITNMQLENRMLTNKIKTEVERNEKLAKQSGSNEMLQELTIQRIRNEMERQHRDFLITICQMFREYVDFTQPITENSVSKTLETVSKKIDELRHSSKY